MRQLRFLILIVLAVMLLYGCGGGSGGGGTPVRTVTIQVRWPGGKATRVTSTAVTTFTVEAYDGTVRVGHITISSPTTTGSLSLPAKDLTFYANGYAVADPGYVTNPATGQPAHGTLTINVAPFTAQSPQYTFVPLATGDVHPLLQAVTTLNAPTTPSLTFTMNNTITAIQPIPGKTTYAVDAGPQPLNSTVQALSADGANIMLDSTALTWSGGSFVASLDNTDPTNANLVPNVTGTVQFTVTDNEVNASEHQVPITAAITYTITASATQQTLTLNTSGGSRLLATCPSYAKSLMLTLSQNSGGAGDAPPPPTTSGPFAIKPVFNSSNTAITGVIIVPSAISFTATGRQATLLVQAWSQTNGKGSLLAEWTLKQQSPVTATLDVDSAHLQSLVYHVTGFVLTPAKPTLVLTNTSATSSGSPNTFLNNMTMQVAATLDSTDSNSTLPIDPRALGPTGLTTDQMTTIYLTVTTPAGPVDPDGNPYIQITGSNSLSGTFSQPVVLTATDPVTSKSGQTTITVQQSNLGYVFH